MADLLFPPHACVSAQRVDTLSNTASSRSVFTGATRTVDRGGDRFRWTVTRSNASDRNDYAERSILRAFRAQARGQTNRIWFSDPAYVQRGSFPSQEVLSNSVFESGTTGWSSAGSDYSISVSDRVLRGARNRVTASSVVVSPSLAVACTAFAPYVARWMVLIGRGTYSAGLGVDIGATAAGFEYLIGANSAGGLRVESAVPYAANISTRLVDSSYSGQLPGDYVDVPFVSLSRCALIDNGPNAFLQSDTLGTTWSASQASISSNATTAPNGTSNADAIVEDSSTAAHFISQSGTKAAAAQDWCAFGWFKRGSGTRDIRLAVGQDGSNAAVCIFDLGSGTAGSVTNVGTVTNGRAVIKSLGDGWYYCAVTARLTTATGTYVEALLINGGNASYAGNGTSSVYAIRLGGAQSSVPVRGALTTGTATTGTLQTGTGLHLKGLPPGVNGLLLPGDRVQIGTQLCEVVAPLNSDAAGLGYLQLAWPLRTPPADNAPVIINNPMARCILTSNEGGWSDTPGGFSEFDFQLEEALDE